MRANPPLLPADFDIEQVLAQIPLNDKIKLLAGQGWWHTEPVPEVGIPSMRMSDGPNGVRGTRFFNGGSSFDLDLAHQIGQALGDECRAKSTHILLGPTINTQRSPLGGRGFESFSEDPHLNGTIAAAYINGLQSTGEVSERSSSRDLHKPFQIVVKESKPWALMTAYNRINGLHYKRILNDILREEWGWDGLIMSDWIGVYSTAESILAGLDLEMPGPTVMRGKFDGPENVLDTPETRSLLRKAAAAAVVLLKNDKGILPLKQGVKTIAVIGTDTKVEFWNENALISRPLKEADFEVGTYSSYCFLMDGIPESINGDAFTRYSTTFVPDQDGDWNFSLNLAGEGNLFVDGNLVIDLSTDPKQGESFFGLGTIDVSNIVKDLKAGQTYSLEVRCSSAQFQSRGSPFTCWGGIRLGGQRVFNEEEAIADAAKLAKDTDAAILVVGLNHDWESEGFDRHTMDLPGYTDKLVSTVLEANPSTIVVNQSGTPVTMPWASSAHTLVHAFYGGNELGNGLADVLFGRVNPSGKLSLTFPKRLEDSPAQPSFGDRGQEAGKILYNEGIFVGYRGFEIRELAPLFPFGYGLSYSTFEYSDLQISEISKEGNFSVSLKVTNTSTVDGREIVQVYIGDPESSLPRPVKELKAFTKVDVKAGETVPVTIPLGREALCYWSTKHWLAESGVYWVLVGRSSADVVLKGDIKLESDITWLGL
ncbi:glycoside hydrolase family 3 protein [Flagelloscypha sp. PMI_526]|nr:glycoside hydrolase family 3 protein [Flagelloscypha sp. PMI_526]